MGAPYVLDVETKIVRRERHDLAALIRDHRDKYLAVDMAGYQEWERPSVFLYEWLSEDDSDTDDVDFHWTEAKYRELVVACPEAELTEVEDVGVPCPACAGGRKIHEEGCLLEGNSWVTDGRQPRVA